MIKHCNNCRFNNKENQDNKKLCKECIVLFHGADPSRWEQNTTDAASNAVESAVENLFIPSGVSKKTKKQQMKTTVVVKYATLTKMRAWIALKIIWIAGLFAPFKIKAVRDEDNVSISEQIREFANYKVSDDFYSKLIECTKEV